MSRRPRSLHQLLLLVSLLGRIPPVMLSPAFLAMAAISAYPWQTGTLQVAAGGLTLIGILGDAVSLALLPRFGRSHGPVTPPLLALALLRTASAFLLGSVSPRPLSFGADVALQTGLTLAHLYATWIEPFRIGVTRLRLAVGELSGVAPVRIVHLTDIHFEGWTPRERRLVDLVRGLEPDLVLMTGDYLNLSSIDDPAAQQGARSLLGQLAECAPTYAVTGSPPVDRPSVVPKAFADLPITWLHDRAVDVMVGDSTIQLIGVDCTADHHADGMRLRGVLSAAREGPLRILLYHTPDLMPLAAELGVHLCLAGHTHGGQLRLPLFGAVVTSSHFWKRYEAGLYREGNTLLYVSRGLGVEGLGAPRARFLAPPEVVVLDLIPADTPRQAQADGEGQGDADGRGSAGHRK